MITIAVLSRFHNPSEETVIGRDVVPPINDDIQLTVEEYRSNLYEVGNIVCVTMRSLDCLIVSYLFLSAFGL